MWRPACDSAASLSERNPAHLPHSSTSRYRPNRPCSRRPRSPSGAAVGCGRTIHQYDTGGEHGKDTKRTHRQSGDQVGAGSPVAGILAGGSHPVEGIPGADRLDTIAEVATQHQYPF